MRRTVVECNDCSCQTDQVTVVDEVPTQELEGTVEDQRLQIQKALKENTASEEALKEFELELENKYCKNLASQVTTNCSLCLEFVKLLCPIKSPKKKKKVDSSTNFLLNLVLVFVVLEIAFLKKF